MAKLIELRDVYKIYSEGLESEVRALDGVSLTIEKGEFVAIARAISTRPPIIMADEPTGALDSKTGHEVLQFLQQLNKEGSTVILITHDNGIAATARRCVRLADGKIVDDRQQEVDWL